MLRLQFCCFFNHDVKCNYCAQYHWFLRPYNTQFRSIWTITLSLTIVLSYSILASSTNRGKPCHWCICFIKLVYKIISPITKRLRALVLQVRAESLCSLWRRANARNVSSRISLRWTNNLINSVHKPKYSFPLPHQRSATVSRVVQYWPPRTAVTVSETKDSVR